jgi:hypothetical protein
LSRFAKESGMRARLVSIAVGISLVSAVAAAEPPKAPVAKAEQPADRAPAAVMAAADAVVVSAPAEQHQQPEASDAAKVPARHARVSSCRCGDQNPSD